MSLKLERLEKVRELRGGGIQARCPACAEGGQDRKGEHLRVYPDGRFGCCVHAKDQAHRRRIFALAGDNTPKPFTVRVGMAKTVKTVPKSIKASLICPFGTLGTPIFNLRAYAIIESKHDNKGNKPKDLERPVPSVPNELVQPAPQSATPKDESMPYCTPDGTLVVPFDSPARYHWWKGGQSVNQTRLESGEPRQLSNGPAQQQRKG
ncbi:MAG: hypothetical protein JWR69_2221 [Pedosphaera sp.]|nr:hypothetical protein [Pedosphaera sp.]